MTQSIRLASLDELPAAGAKGFRIDRGDPGDGDTHRLIVYRNGPEIYVYQNSCPHTGGPLDWVPDRFLDIDKRHFLCATHGALFRLADGHCVHGPCRGDSLTPVAHEIRDGAIWVAPPEPD
ncbi:MAG: Rieske (2Fe-2S) protein [Alphaproteobacteria bacterium]